MKHELKKLAKLGLLGLMRLPLAPLAARSLAGCHLLPRRVWIRLPIAGTFQVEVPGGTPFLYRSESDDGIGRQLFFGGISGWAEPETVNVFPDLIVDARRFVDVGANTGLYTLLACSLNPEVRVLAFEPVPRLHDHCLELVRLNGFSDRVEVRRQAVSSAAGTALLQVPQEQGFPTKSSLKLKEQTDIHEQLLPVSVVDLDSAVADLPVDLVKIDVEGVEDRVLAGMQRLLSRQRPALIVEFHGRENFEPIGALLAPHDYRPFRLLANGPRRLDQLRPDSNQSRSHVLFLPSTGRVSLDSLHRDRPDR